MKHSKLSYILTAVLCYFLAGTITSNPLDLQTSDQNTETHLNQPYSADIGNIVLPTSCCSPNSNLNNDLRSHQTSLFLIPKTNSN